MHQLLPHQRRALTLFRSLCNGENERAIGWLIDYKIAIWWGWCNIFTHVCLDASCSNNAEKVLNIYQVQHWQLINNSCYDYWVFLLLVRLVCFGNTIRPAVRDLTTNVSRWVKQQRAINQKKCLSASQVTAHSWKPQPKCVITENHEYIYDMETFAFRPHWPCLKR